MSLKAGGIGLNLVEASLVVLMDPWYDDESNCDLLFVSRLIFSYEFGP